MGEARQIVAQARPTRAAGTDPKVTEVRHFLRRSASPSTFTHWILKKALLYDLWKPSVEACLNQPGRTIVTGMELARSVGRSNYADVSVADWRLLAKLAIECGYRSVRLDGVQVWQRASA
jgi:hypothetical protein